MKKFVVAAALVLAAAGSMLHCAGELRPEERIRQRIEEAEQAAERRDLETLGEYVSRDYTDENGLDRRALLGLVGRRLLGSRSLHVITKISSIEITAPHRATVKMFVAAAARDVGSVEDLRGVHADILRVDLQMAEEDGAGWQVTGSSWRSAELTDLLGL